MRFHVVNLGCKVNRVESDAFERQLSGEGNAKSRIQDADLIVVNTCTVTAVAEKKTRKSVRQALRANPAAKVVVTGCASTQRPEFYEALSDRVVVVPKWEVAEFLQAYESTDPSFDAPTKARMGVKVQDGCANECAYCIVHKVRGPEVSIDPQQVLADARALVSHGVSEVVLTGINLGRYDHEGTGLEGLLRMLLEECPGCRFRLSSIEPDNLDDLLIELVAASGGRVCRQFHLPLQSGCTKVLREMGRKYTAEEFASLLGRIRAAIPSASVTTDVIAGFPGETEEDFEETCSFVRECGFSKMHVFPYSEREGTPAAARNDQVPHDIRIKRAAKLRRIADEMRASDLAARKGARETAVVEDGTDCLTESYHWLKAPPGSKNGDVVEIEL